MSAESRALRAHWTEAAERVTDGDPRVLGEDDNGDFYVPTCTTPGQERWAQRFSPRNPLHWRFWLRSRLTNRLAFLEAASGNLAAVDHA